MGDIGPERAHFDVLPIAEDVPAPAVEVLVEVVGQVEVGEPAGFEYPAGLDVVPGR